MINRLAVRSIVTAGVLFAILVGLVGVASGQGDTIRASFEKNKPKYTREHFVMGEDATSGYDYLFYKLGPRIVKIRSIWSASYTNELRVEDFYFDGASMLVERLTGSKRQLASLKKGANSQLRRKEELFFRDSKLTTWTKDGRGIVKSDPRWAETERSELEYAKAELENYNFLKDNNDE